MGEAHVRLEFEKAATDGDSHRMGPVAGTEFVHNMSKVGFNGLFADEQKLTDVQIAVSRGDMFQDFDFA